MSWFHIHSWSRWTVITMMDKRRNSVWDMQERVCGKCGLSQRKDFR